MGYKGNQPFRVRPTPQRTCIACREVKAKREMVRILRTPQETIEVDETGKRPGRGAYLCRKRSCWELGLNKDRLSHLLKAKIAPEQVISLREYAKGLKL